MNLARVNQSPHFRRTPEPAKQAKKKLVGLVGAGK